MNTADAATTIAYEIIDTLTVAKLADLGVDICDHSARECREGLCALPQAFDSSDMADALGDGGTAALEAWCEELATAWPTPIVTRADALAVGKLAGNALCEGGPRWDAPTDQADALTRFLATGGVTVETTMEDDIYILETVRLIRMWGLAA